MQEFIFPVKQGCLSVWFAQFFLLLLDRRRICNSLGSDTLSQRRSRQLLRTKTNWWRLGFCCDITWLEVSPAFQQSSDDQHDKGNLEASEGFDNWFHRRQLFLFKFQGRGDIHRVLEGRPWLFNKHVLLLDEVCLAAQPQSMALDTTPFWLWLYDLPISA